MAKDDDGDTIAFPESSGRREQPLSAIKAKFLARYPRVMRPPEFVYIDGEEAEYFPSPLGLKPGKLKEPPVIGYVLLDRLRLNEIMPVNELLCYRMLRHLYGPPDYAVVLDHPKEGKAYPYDWGYCVRVHDALVAELRRISHSVFLVLWGAEGSESETRKEAIVRLKQFVDDIRDALRRSKSLFHGKQERKRAASEGIPNPFAEKYAAGVELLRLAQKSDKPRDWKRWKWGEAIDYPVTGSVYLAAILFFYTALEAFEQLVRNYTLKSEYRGEDKLRQIQETPFKDRIAQLHELCDGFYTSPAPKDGELYKRLRILSRVRNEVIHGNTARDTRIYALSEDGFVFMYGPERDDEDKAWTESYVPFARELVRRRHAEYVKRLVDDVVLAIINSLREEHKPIACGFRDRPVLMKESDGRLGLLPETIR
jgi:hypothetical protein